MTTWNDIRRKLGVFEGEYAGVPLLVEDVRVCVAPQMPFYTKLHGKSLESFCDGDGEADDHELVNSWWIDRCRGWIYIFRSPEGRIVHFLLPGGAGVRAEQLIRCCGISQTMDVESERRAMVLLRSLIPEHMADSYEITGSFFETSARSGMTYVFRRMATTVAFRAGDKGSRFVAALCLHPIAYYDATPLGAMTPTDDVIAHLVLMRTDERRFWAKANQHGAMSPGAML